MADLRRTRTLCWLERLLVVIAVLALGTVVVDRMQAAWDAISARLSLPRVHVRTLVFDVSDPAALRHSAGHLRGTALPWRDGNSAVAGHRDSAFRELRHVRPGDDIRFVTPYGTFGYRVTRAFVVYPDDTWVLDDEAAALTLITCFPFRWVGTAPERWIIHAQRKTQEDPRGVIVASR